MSEKNNERLKYSVLMPLWYKEKTDYLEKSLESMLTQTVKPSEIVMIADHELFGETQNLLRKIQEKICRKKRGKGTASCRPLPILMQAQRWLVFWLCSWF